VDNVHWVYGRKINGNYSTLVLDLLMQRQVGHYIISYYVPSALLVFMSMVSFWLEPSAVPGRVTLGTSTWLTLITLTQSTSAANLPKVSYIKFIDIWFLVCTCFIFFSLMEFALVNIISRRKEEVAQMTKISASQILAEGLREAGRSAFTTPSFSRRNSTYDLNVARSRRNSAYHQPAFAVSGNLLTVTTLEHQQAKETSPRELFSKSEDVHRGPGPGQVDVQEDEERQGEGKAGQLWGWLVKRVAEKRRESLHVNVTTEHNDQDQDDHTKYWLQEQFEGMTYEEIAIWVDTKARIAFPLLFFLFNCFYWVLVADDELYQHFVSV